MKSNHYSIEKGLSRIKGLGLQRLVQEILFIFLPLDVDMQVLEILTERGEEGKDVKDPRKYLEEMYKGNIKYTKKLGELQKKIQEVGVDISEGNEKFNEISGITNNQVHGFFKKLDNKVTESKELLNHSWKIKGVNTFHDWYCQFIKLHTETY